MSELARRSARRSLLALATAIVLLPASAAQASSYTVTTLLDSGPGSFRQAVADANANPGADQIGFDPGLSGAIAVTSAKVQITDSVTIDGPGASVLALDGGPSNFTGLLSVTGSATNKVEISGLTIERGSSNDQHLFHAGGIDNGDDLTLRKVVIRDNFAIPVAGGVFNSERGRLTVVDSLFVDNNVEAYLTGGFSGYGGGIFNGGQLTVRNSTFWHNRGLAGFSFGGGIATLGRNAATTISNSTFGLNQAGEGGGLSNGNNKPGYAGSVHLSNTILGINTISQGTTGGGPDCEGQINSDGYNLVSRDTSCTFTSTTGDQVGTGVAPIDPGYSNLSDNGGPTFTAPLEPGSPALDAGNPGAPLDGALDGASLRRCEPSDQRAVPRPQNGRCDIGAYEAIKAPDAVIDGHPTSQTNDTNATFSFHATEPSASFECKLDAESFSTCNSPKSYTGFTAPSSHTFEVRAVDFLGNPSGSSDSFAWNVSTTPLPHPPDTVIDTHPVDQTTDTNASFTFHVNGIADSFECRLDTAAFSSCTSPKTYSGLEPGSQHTFEVRAVNNTAGADPTPASFTWTLNTVPPPPDTFIDIHPSDPTADTSASFDFHADISGSTFECSLDGANFQTCTGPQGYSALAPGDHSFGVRAIDPVARPDTTPATFIWAVHTVPDTAIDVQPPDPTTATSASFSFHGIGTPASFVPSSFECRLDAGAFQTCTSPKAYAGLSPGAHTFEVRAVDDPAGPDPAPASAGWTITASQCMGRTATIAGTAGNDRGAAELDGTAGNDVIFAGAGNDSVYAGQGNDLICAGGGTDIVSGGMGKDRIFGGPGADRLVGRPGDDSIFGGAGDDMLLGRAGADQLFGGRGDDFLAGGPGSDQCRGGPGSNRTAGCER